MHYARKERLVNLRGVPSLGLHAGAGMVAMERQEGRIHPSLGSPGDVVAYTPSPLFVTRAKEEREKQEDLPISILVHVPHADLLHIFAHRQWRAGMLLADLLFSLPLLLENKVVLELGAGTALPSIVANRCTQAKFVACTDYDTPPLIKTLKANVLGNTLRSAKIRVAGHTWGQAIEDVEDLLPIAIQGHNYDVILLADCIWDELSHEALVRSLSKLLSRAADARVLMVSGLHTGRSTIVSFLRRAYRSGIQLTSLPHAINTDGFPWPPLDGREEEIRQAQRKQYAEYDAIGRAADLVMEMEIADHSATEEVEQTNVLQDRQRESGNEPTGRFWRSTAYRLTGRRRTFVIEERQEERKEVEGVHQRNRWITFLSLARSPSVSS